MAVVARTATQISHTTPVTVAASPGVAANVPDGDTFPNGGNTILVMNNTGGSTYYVDIYLSAGQDDLTAPARRHSVPATTIQEVKLGSPALYGETTLVKAENVAVKLLAKTV
jgi:hypothetical protein